MLALSVPKPVLGVPKLNMAIPGASVVQYGPYKIMLVDVGKGKFAAIWFGWSDHYNAYVNNGMNCTVTMYKN